MKLKYSFSLVLLFLLSTFCVLAQKKDESGDTKGDRQIKGVLIGGINLTQVDGDQVYGFHKVGANVGVGGILPLGHHLSLSLDILYDERGAYRKYAPQSDSISHIPYYSLKWNYLTAPLMLHYEDKTTWTFGLGFSWGRMIAFKELEHNKPQSWNRTDTITYRTKNDFDIIADIRFRIWKHLKMDFSYSYSMAKIRTRLFNNGAKQWNRDQYNNVITIRLLYYLNEKYMPPRFTFHHQKKKPKTKDK